MQIRDIIGKTASAKDSAHIALNASGEAYAYLEAVRTDTVGQLLNRAAKNYQDAHGCSPAKAFEVVGQRGVYIEELARGESTFHAARKELQSEPGHPIAQTI